MENKDQNNAFSYPENRGEEASSASVVHQPPPDDANALSLEQAGAQELLISQEQHKEGLFRRISRLARRFGIALLLVLVLASGVVLFVLIAKNKTQQGSSSSSSQLGTVEISLSELLQGKDLTPPGLSNVTINGAMQLNGSLVLTPSLQPTGAKPGQLYYDQSTNQLAYFNGQIFVFLNSPPPSSGGVQSLGGATGQLVLGDGLSLDGTQLNNDGVLSVQGETGDITFTAGPGLVINGTTFSNSGVLSVVSGSPNVTVTDDGSGGVTISMTSGAGTITSSGGTAGAIPLFTASQNIEDSIISQSGLTVTISGDLSVVTGGLSLSNALTVSNGGSGATSFANNGVLVGQGTGAFAAVAAGGPGLCLISTGGLPSWGACPGGGGVSSLNGLSGGLSIANASGAGSTITIDDASTSAKGIASFNATNFSVASGAVNTIQNINTGATPTFAGLNTNSITPSAALTVGSASQSLTLQGNATTTLTATNGANTTALTFVAPTANVTYRLQTATAGTYDLCTTAGNCVASGAVTTPGGTTNRLAKFTGSQIIGDSIIIDNGSNVDIGGTLSVQGNATFTTDLAVNGGDITASGALNITPGGTLTVGVTGQQLTLQGNASTSIAATSGASTTTLTFQAPTANVTYRLPTAAAGAYDLCTTAGNCVGSGGGVTTSGGTTNRLAKFSGTQVIDNSTITDDGTTVSTSVDLIIQGGSVTIGVANTQTGSVTLAHSGSAFSGTILQGPLTGDRTYTLPDIDGTLCLSSGNCSGSGSSNTLQAAYDAGNTIITSTTRDISFTLADSATDGNFIVTAATGATGYVGIVRADGAGTADPAQLLLLDNLDTNRVQPVGLRIQSAGGGMTTAIDLTDAEIVAAINIAANDIVGTTGNIDLSNFDVIGATGNITTSGTVNGQIISSAASFTGTVAVAGNTTLSGDLAVNGGDITASGALNITPGGTLTVGVTGQQLILQGNASTQLTATGDGFTTAVGFAGTATGAVAYNFDRTVAAGTYTICTSIGNCASSGGGVTTSGGTTGTLAKFTGAQTLGDSLLSESGGTVTVNGNLNLVSGNQFRVNGTQISSGNLSNDADLAKLSASQTFTGNTVAFQNSVNSSNAFNVQNVAGSRILTVDSSSALVTLGTASTIDGKLVFSNVSNANTVTILPGTPSANRTLTLPDASGIICTDSGNCAGAGATLQTGYNFSIGGTTPKIKVNSSLGGVDIQDADTPTGANLLNIRASNGAGLGSVMFGVGNTGAVTLQNSANSTSAFRLLTAGGTTVLVGDTTNGQILLGQSGTLSGTLVFRNASNANTITLTTGTPTTGRTISLPDADGTVCLSSGNCSGSGSSNTLQAAYDAGNTITTTTARNIAFTLADTATDANFLVDLQCDTSCSTNGRFAIQDDGVDTFSIGPSGSTLFKNSADSTTAFQVQNSAGSRVLLADTSNNLVRIVSTGSISNISLTSGTGALQIGPDTSNNLAIDDNEIMARNNGATDTLFLQKLGGGLTIQANTTLVKPTANGTTTLQVQNTSSNEVITVDTSGNRVVLGKASTLAGALVFQNATNANTITLNSATATAGRTISLPNEDGTICLQSSANCGFAASSGSANYIQNQSASDQTADFRISGTGRIGTALQVPLLDTATATALGIGTTNATNITLGSTTSTSTLTLGRSTASNTISIGSATTAAGNTQTINVGTSATSTGKAVITIGNTNAASSVTLQAGTGNINLLTNSASASVIAKSSTNSTTAFQVQNSSSVAVLDVDTANSRVGIGIAAPTQALDVNGNINIPVTSSTVGAIMQNGSPWIHSAGSDSTNFFAAGAGNFTNTGNNNIGIGEGALQGLTTAFDNVALGAFTLASNNTGLYNIAIGPNALEDNTDGDENVAIGRQSLNANTLGDSNTAVGIISMSGNTTGNNNTAVGWCALCDNSTGGFNTAVGYGALQSNTTANDNTAFGFDSLNDNETGVHNSAFGNGTLSTNIGGSFNASFGNQSFLALTSGNRNTGLGFQAGYTSVVANAVTTGSENTYVGFQAGPGSSTQYSNAAAIGAHSTIHQSDSMELGCFAGINGCTVSTKIGIANTVPGFLLHVGGGAVASGTSVARFENAGGSCTVTPNTAGGITCTSDERLKKNITGFYGAMDIINQIDIKQYNMRADPDSAQKQIGVIAQQLEVVLPSLVKTDDQGYKSVSYSGLTPVLLQAIKEQQVEIGRLQNDRAALLQNGDDAHFNALNVSGHTTLARLTVEGDVTVKGTLTVQAVAVSGDLTVGGHIVSNGKTPTIKTVSGSARVEGTDTAGTITITPGKFPSAELATLIFAKSYAKAPHVVITSTNAAGLTLHIYADKTTKDVKIRAEGLPRTGMTYKYDYVVIQ